MGIIVQYMLGAGVFMIGAGILLMGITFLYDTYKDREDK